jgi:hypothetical protein
MLTAMRAGFAARMLFLGSALCVGLLVPGTARACDCSDSGPPCRAFVNTQAIFIGKVVRLGTLATKLPSGDIVNYILATFEVERSFRGVNGAIVEVVTEDVGGQCGFEFKQGQRYLVYANAFPAAGKLYAGICSRTRAIAEADEDLEYLNHKDDPGHGAGIEGTIVEVARDPKDRTRTFGAGPAVGVVVRIEGESGKWTAVTDKNGQFRQWSLKPGKYKITPAFSNRYLEHTETVEVTQEICGRVYMVATPRP